MNQGKGDTRAKIIQFLNKCISLGVAGFRIDAAKHMWPGDLEIIYNGLNNLSIGTFPLNVKPFIFQEVIDHGGEGITRCVSHFIIIAKRMKIDFLYLHIELSIHHWDQ